MRVTSVHAEKDGKGILCGGERFEENDVLSGGLTQARSTEKEGQTGGPKT